MRLLLARLVLSSGFLQIAGAMPAVCTNASAQSLHVMSAVGADTVGAAAVIQTKATVIGIDAAPYSTTLKGAGGRIFEVTVSPEVGDLSKLRIGDLVDIAYHESILIHADKVKSNGIRERIDTTAIIPASGGVVASGHSIQVLATIEKVDVKRRLVTLRGPLKTGVVEAGPDVSLVDLKVGDSVRAELVTATAVKVSPVPPR